MRSFNTLVQRKNKNSHFFVTFLSNFLHNIQMFIIFALSNKNKGIMKKPSKEIRKLETELIYYIRLYRELRGREFVENLLMSLDLEISLLVEKLKRM